MRLFFLSLFILTYCSCAPYKEREQMNINFKNIVLDKNVSTFTFDLESNSKKSIPINEIIFFHRFKISYDGVEIVPISKIEADPYKVDENVITYGRNIIHVESKIFNQFSLREGETYIIEYSIKYKDKEYNFKNNVTIPR